MKNPFTKFETPDPQVSFFPYIGYYIEAEKNKGILLNINNNGFYLSSNINKIYVIYYLFWMIFIVSILILIVPQSYDEELGAIIFDLIFIGPEAPVTSDKLNYPYIGIYKPSNPFVYPQDFIVLRKEVIESNFIH